jgi:hypothetical protein
MEIEVKQHHIEQGKMCNEHYCPVSLALKEATGNNWEVSEFEILDLKNKRIYDTPTSVRYFVRKFDNQVKNKKDHIYVGLQDFQPFKFYLNREHSRFYFQKRNYYDGRSLVKKWGLV